MTALLAEHRKRKLPDAAPDRGAFDPETEALMRVRFLKLADVRKRTSLSVRQIYRLVAEGKFPAPIPISTNRKAFIESEVQSWIGEKMRAAKKKAA